MFALCCWPQVVTTACRVHSFVSQTPGCQAAFVKGRTSYWTSVEFFPTRKSRKGWGEGRRRDRIRERDS